MAFNEITDAREIDELLEESKQQPVILFKHSLTCPISAAAHREMAKMEGAINTVIVQKSRGVSNEVTQRTGVRHESPQAFIFRNGASVWNASHYDITKAKVEKALSDNA